MTHAPLPDHCPRLVDADAGAGTLVFGYDGLRVRVVTGDPAPLSWLDEFLCPSFERATSGEAHCRVALVEEPEAYRATLTLGEAPGGGSIDTFALDRQVLSFTRWAGPGLTARDAAAALFYQVSADGRTFRVLTEPGNLAARVALMRAVRELAMGHAGDRGLLLHAAAAAVAHRVVVLAGPSAAGKTTLLLHLLRSGAAEYVANDRVRVSCDEVPPRARGIPTIVTIRARTRERFGALAERLHERAYQFRRGLREPVPGPRLPLRPWSDGRVGLSPAQLADALDVARVAEGEIAAVVFPEITRAEGGISLRPLSSSEATDRLAASVLGSGPRQQRSAFFRLPGAPPAPASETLRARCHRLALAVPCVECRLGEDAYVDPGSAETVLALTR